MNQLTTLVEQGIRLSEESDRLDLRSRLEQTRERLVDPSVRVVVAGELGQGKSQLINALLGVEVCPVDDDVATVVTTVIRHGDTPEAALLTAGSDSGEVQRRRIRIDELARHVSERGNPGNEQRLLAAEVSVPRSILSGGLALIDSPGVGGLQSAHALTTLAALPTADAVLLVSDASQEYTEPELQFVRQAMAVCPNVACILTKTDLYPRWREIAELNRGHLARLDAKIPLIPVSAQLRLDATRQADLELNTESNFPALVAHLRGEVLAASATLQARRVEHDLRSVTENLALALNSELSTLLDPSTTSEVIAKLEAAKQKTADLRRRSSKWQVTLNDGIADLIADMEHDLRDRVRLIGREADHAIDSGDPGQKWEELTDWFEERVTIAISETFVWSDERARWLSERVREHFAEGEVALPSVRVGNTDGVLDPVDVIPTLDPGDLGPMQKLLIGMRGSYGGVLMIGLLTGIVGMSLINPFSVAAGLLIGGKAYRDDRTARLKKRQGEAKALIRGQLDEVIFQVGKELRDRLRLVQRTTRDHFTEIADERLRSLSDSAAAAQKAATMYKSEREQRIVEIRTRLKKVEALRADAPRPARKLVAVA